MPQSPLRQSEGALNTLQLNKAGKMIGRRQNRPEFLLFLRSYLWGIRSQHTHFSLLPNWYPVTGWQNWPGALGWAWEGADFWKCPPDAGPQRLRRPTPAARMSKCPGWFRLPGALGPECVVDCSATPSHFFKINVRGGERVFNDVFLFSRNKIFCFYFKPAACPPLGPSRCLQ